MSHNRYGLARTLSSARSIEAPCVVIIEPQVRTAASVPFQDYMRGSNADAPTVETVGLQVRTAASVAFQDYMKGAGKAQAPEIDGVSLQVRTAASVPFAAYMAGGEAPRADTVEPQVRTAASIPFNPYMLGAHAEELLKKRVMLSPVLVEWTFTVDHAERFLGWLGTREILMSEARLSSDTDVHGIRYGGTYRLESAGAGAVYKTVWGFTSEVARSTFDRLTSDDCATASLVQIDLIDFVRGLRGFARQLKAQSLVSAAAGRA